MSQYHRVSYNLLFELFIKTTSYNYKRDSITMEKTTEDSINEWVKVFETDNKPKADLIEARLRDENIEYRVKNNKSIEQTVFVGNIGLGLPIQIYVKQTDLTHVNKILNEDRSELLKKGDQFGTLDDAEKAKE